MCCFGFLVALGINNLSKAAPFFSSSLCKNVCMVITLKADVCRNLVVLFRSVKSQHSIKSCFRLCFGFFKSHKLSLAVKLNDKVFVFRFSAYKRGTEGILFSPLQAQSHLCLGKLLSWWYTLDCCLLAHHSPVV